uniref:Uncharacterized protein n=1 Tax=Arundo donax TaxID=35708 RepID=A0A0A9CZ82_ARUDO
MCGAVAAVRCTFPGPQKNTKLAAIGSSNITLSTPLLYSYKAVTTLRKSPSVILRATQLQQ